MASTRSMANGLLSATFAAPLPGHIVRSTSWPVRAAATAGEAMAAYTASPTVSKTTPPWVSTASRRRSWCRRTASR